MSVRSAAVAGAVIEFLRRWVREGHPGTVLGPDGGYTIFPWAPSDVRMPDASYVSRRRLPHLPERGWSDAPPEFAAEVVSPTDTFSDTEEKARDYIRAGVDLVWVIVPSTESVHIWRKDGSRAVAQSGEVLSGEDVLPGFSVPVDALFEDFD